MSRLCVAKNLQQNANRRVVRRKTERLNAARPPPERRHCARLVDFLASRNARERDAQRLADKFAVDADGDGRQRR